MEKINTSVAVWRKPSVHTVAVYVSLSDSHEQRAPSSVAQPKTDWFPLISCYCLVDETIKAAGNETEAVVTSVIMWKMKKKEENIWGIKPSPVLAMFFYTIPSVACIARDLWPPFWILWQPGELVFAPGRSRSRFSAGSYLSEHWRKIYEARWYVCL